ncbi:MAG: alpha/beta hydrolase [Kofleriaceae bacterium]|nr:alpha/beta hydrolase [Kofleriaceae bacterium]MBP6841796.1 alpha/beta hydrolase [Kofleriaceae bacterium]MBP9208194.1 alpha/beta hydrolase [Kofleriaceae bacterium]
MTRSNPSPLRWIVALTLLGTTAGCGLLRDDQPATPDANLADADPACPAVPGPPQLELAYAAYPGVDPNLTSLDVYPMVRSPGCPAAPVVVWIHGGGWAIGDKSQGLRDKVPLWQAAGWAVVSINYRLSPDTPSTDPARVMFPDHPTDVGAALAWILAHAAELELDPDRMAVFGHSAGGHLAALVSTDPAYLGAHGLGLDRIRCTGSLDIDAYDIPASLLDANERQREIFENAFGTDTAVQRQASPISHVVAGVGIPPMLVVVRGQEARRANQESFVAALRAAGIAATTLDAAGLSHEEVTDHVGADGDTIMTPPVMQFLADCFAR